MRTHTREKNRGFSLVELIITIAIMSIVGGAITSFIVMTQRNYNNGSAETELQTEAQLVSNQLQDLMIDAAKGISYSYKKEIAEGSVEDSFLMADTEISAGDVVTTKTLYIYDEDKYYELVWDSTAGELRYKEYDKANAPDGSAGELLAEFVSGFSVDLTELSSNRTVKYVIILEKSGTGRSYTTSHKIKLRNEVAINKNKDEIYEGGEEPVSDPSKINISPNSLYLWPGENMALSAVVSSADGSVPSQSVTWELTGRSNSTDTVIENNTLKAAANEIGSGDGDMHSFYVKAYRVLSTGSKLYSDEEITVHMRGISSIQVADNLGSITESNNRTVKSGKENVTLTANITGYNLDGITTNKEKGGTNISITAGEQYLSAGSIVYDKEAGTVSFNVRSDIDFTITPSPVVTFHFVSAKAGFSNVSCDISYTIEAADKIVIVSDGLWNRDGTININFENVDEQYLDRRNGQVWVKGNRVINVSFQYISSDGTESQWHTMGNQNSYGGSQDTNSHVILTFEQGNVLNLKATLKKNTFSFSAPYSDGNLYYWNSYNDIKQIRMKVDFGGYQTGEAFFDIKDVAFSYRKSSPNDTSDGSWNNDITKVYVTSQDALENQYTLYYHLTDGWDENSTDYTLNTKRYVGIVDAESSDTRHDLTVADTTGTGAAAGLNKVTFTISDDEISSYMGKTITEIYEYNPFFADAGLNYSQFRDKYKQIDGCEGKVEFHFVNSNIHVSHHTNPIGMYCPTVAEMDGASYYYITETARFHVFQDGDTQRAEYQIWQSTSWNTQINMTWKIENGVAGWYDAAQNIYIRYYTYMQPSDLYCPTYDELKANVGIFDDVYYNIPGKTRERFYVERTIEWIWNGWAYVPITVDYAKYQVKDNSGNWKSQYTLKWQTVNGIEGWYDVYPGNNVTINYPAFPVWHQTPSSLYCPSYSDIHSANFAPATVNGVSGHYYTLQSRTERFFVYQSAGVQKADFQVKNSSSAGWETQYSLEWKDNNRWQDLLGQNIYSDKDPVPSVLFCPTYQQLQDNGSSWITIGNKGGYKYDISKDECFLVFQSGHKDRLYYYKKQSNQNSFNNSHRQYTLYWHESDSKYSVAGWYTDNN